MRSMAATRRRGGRTRCSPSSAWRRASSSCARSSAGTQVGYNGRWTAKSRRKLATIDLGYADGYPRNASWTDTSSGGSAIVGGVICPFVGSVSMDLIIIDVSEAPAEAARRGSTVTLIGGPLDLEAVGAGARTIGYEILTRLGRRHTRRYVGLDGRSVAKARDRPGISAKPAARSIIAGRANAIPAAPGRRSPRRRRLRRFRAGVARPAARRAAASSRSRP